MVNGEFKKDMPTEDIRHFFAFFPYIISSKTIFNVTNLFPVCI